MRSIAVEIGAQRHHLPDRASAPSGDKRMKWLIAICIAIVGLLAMPAAIAASKASVRGKGRVAGAALSIGLAFSAMFDPKIAAAIDNIEKKKEIGDTEDGLGGEKLD